MALQKSQHLNQLLQRLPPGVLVNSKWLREQASRAPVSHRLCKRGWLERLRPRVYRRPTAVGRKPAKQESFVRWELAVASAQALVERRFHVGGATALDLLGLSHFLDLGRKNRVWLYDARHTAPSWLVKLSVDVELVLNKRPLFKDDDLGLEWRRLELSTGRVGGAVESSAKEEPWDQFLRMSGAERAALELLQEVGTTVVFHTADRLFEGFANLRPAMLTRLLRDCTSVKAKRLFFFFAGRHAHAWEKPLNPDDFDLGRGKRQIVKGGRLHSKYEITVPVEMMPEGDDQDAG